MQSRLEKEIEAEDFVEIGRDRCLDQPTRQVALSGRGNIGARGRILPKAPATGCSTLDGTGRRP